LTNLLLGQTGYTGITGPPQSGVTAYFIGDFQVGPIVTTNSENILVSTSFQVLSATEIQNFSASIMRSNTGMTAQTLIDASIYNLASRTTSTDVYCPIDGITTASFTALNTSLFTFSQLQANNGINGLTVSMQAIDSPGNTSSYYAVRVNVPGNTTANSIYYGNFRISALHLSP
jgi:hypothetical protein